MLTQEIIAIAVIAIMEGLYIYWKVKEKGLKDTAIKFIVEAEGKLQNGDEKMNYCIEKIAMLVPLPFSLFITGNMVKKLVQAVFDNIKVALDYQIPVKEEK